MNKDEYDEVDEEYLGADLIRDVAHRIIFHMWAIFAAVYTIEFLGWIAQIAWAAREKELGN